MTSYTSNTWLINLFLLVIAAVPGVLSGYVLRNKHVIEHLSLPKGSALQMLASLCYDQPLLAVNVLFFIDVDVWFWLLSLFQGSTWLIDPYWTIIPVMIGIYYLAHPHAISLASNTRGAVALGLLLLWSVRLTHSYLRREEWRIGEREDWRFARLRTKLGWNWLWISFFAVYFSQHLMLVGITMPFLPISTVSQPWDGVWDTVVAGMCLAGILIAWVSDNQLRSFMVMNEQRVAVGKPPVLVLDTGLWYYSRHPNYFGEQLWWWSLGLWALYLGHGWMLIGTAFNSLCLVKVTFMVEDRILEKPQRVPSYKAYQNATSMWVPWLKRKPKAS